MYNKKHWIPTEKQKEEIKSLMNHPGWGVVLDRAEFEHNENGKTLLSIIQSLDTKNSDDLLTLEKEGIKAEAVTNFITGFKNFTQEIYSPE